MKKLQIHVFTLLLFVFSSAPLHGAAELDPLPSWNDAANKHAIINFVTAVSRAGAPDFVPVADRIATFDMDGTILVEKPEAAVMAFSMNSIAEIADTVPETQEQPYRAYRDQDNTYLNQNLIQVLTTPYLGLTPAQYILSVERFANTVKHPRFDKPYKKMFYAPMLELIAYLHANQFSVYIVSGSDQDFVRGMTHTAIGLPYSHMVGAQIELEFQNDTLTRTAHYRSLGVAGAGKPMFIAYQIGTRPIFSAGNSAVDQEMFEYTSANSNYRSLVMWVDHDDAEREYSYAAGVKPEAGWLQVSIKSDFTKIFND